MSHHEIFDLAHWNAVLAGVNNYPEMGVLCDSPISIVTIERHRQLLRDIGDMGPTVPTDRFVFAKGIPEGPHATKVNGIPHRPAGRPWPVDSVGEPMAFLMQFCFADSHDHIGNTPGEVLSMFVRQPMGGGSPGYYVRSSDPSSLTFEWNPIDLAEPATIKDYHAPIFEFPSCYGVRYRSFDGESDDLIPLLARVVPRTELPHHETFQLDQLRACVRHPRIKIGGAPYWRDPAHRVSAGRFLASFWGVCTCMTDFPWTNESEALSTQDGMADRNYLEFDGPINLFLLDDGTVEWERERM